MKLTKRFSNDKSSNNFILTLLGLRFMNIPSVKGFSVFSLTVIFFFITVIVEIAFFGNLKGFSAPVSTNEATMIADMWYAMELNSGYLNISDTEKDYRFANMENHQIHYLVTKNELVDEYPEEQTVLAYIIEYIPNGFVVVSGDDRIDPFMVCSAESEFRWDQPERNFLRYYLGKVMPALWKHMPEHIHESWSILRGKMSKSKEQLTFDDTGRAIFVKWNTALWDQNGFYNDTCMAHNGGYNVYVGCTATAMAIKMKFHSWPQTGSNSHSYSDTWGGIQYSHDVNFGNQTYVWESMPDSQLAAANPEVARIMYHAGVAVDMDYDTSASGAWPTTTSMNSYFRYRGTQEWTANHEYPLETSIIGKLPVVLSTTAHTVLACGYRDDISPHYFLNCGWNGVDNSWYNLDSIPGTGDNTIDRSYPYAQPYNWTYVDVSWSGYENGNIYQPYNTLDEGVGASFDGGELFIKTGSYTGSGNVPITFDKESAIRAYAGDVVIGGNVWIKNYEAIRLYGGGELKVTPD